MALPRRVSCPGLHVLRAVRRPRIVTHVRYHTHARQGIDWPMYVGSESGEHHACDCTPVTGTAAGCRAQRDPAARVSMQAVTLFQQLEAGGLQPDAKSYTALMQAFQEAGDLEGAQRAYSAAAAAGSANLVATNALVDVLVDAQRLQDAARVVQTLQRRVVKGGGDVQVRWSLGRLHGPRSPPDLLCGDSADRRLLLRALAQATSVHEWEQAVSAVSV